MNPANHHSAPAVPEDRRLEAAIERAEIEGFGARRNRVAGPLEADFHSPDPLDAFEEPLDQHCDPLDQANDEWERLEPSTDPLDQLGDPRDPFGKPEDQANENRGIEGRRKDVPRAPPSSTLESGSSQRCGAPTTDRPEPEWEPPLEVRALRRRMRLTQREFAGWFGFPVATLRHWELGNRRPAGPALVLLHMIRDNPRAVLRAVRQARLRDPASVAPIEQRKSHRAPPGYGDRPPPLWKLRQRLGLPPRPPRTVP